MHCKVFVCVCVFLPARMYSSAHHVIGSAVTKPHCVSFQFVTFVLRATKTLGQLEGIWPVAPIVSPVREFFFCFELLLHPFSLLKTGYALF